MNDSGPGRSMIIAVTMMMVAQMLHGVQVEEDPKRTILGSSQRN